MLKLIACISAGSVEYRRAEAEINIDDFIAALQEAKEDGATHVIGLSDNYRGAQYVRLGMPRIEWNNDENGDDEV